MLTRFRGGFAKTLSYLFPDIGIDESKFNVLPRMCKRGKEQKRGGEVRGSGQNDSREAIRGRFIHIYSREI